MHHAQVLGAKLSAPRPPRYVLTRPRIEAALRQALNYRLTLLQAGTGYGKSTALAHLANTDIPLFWYSAAEGDADPQQFVAYANAAFRHGVNALPDASPALIQEGLAPSDAIDMLLNRLDNLLVHPSLLVIDDYHLAQSASVDALAERFVTFLPKHLHVILATRHQPTWKKLVVWRARGEVCDINSDTLAFTQDEIETLFRTTYGLALTAEDAALLRERTEGWPIALQLVWQKMRANPKSDVATLLSKAGSLDTLFEYLMQQVIAKQSRETQNFLLQSAVLREMDTAACDAITRRRTSSARLAYLRNQDLFIVALGDGRYRYHHLFHSFLRHRATRLHPKAVLHRHKLAGEFYHRRGNPDEAIYHWLAAQAFEQAASELEQVGENLLRIGRLDTLAAWIDALPTEMVTARPLLMYFLGDLARLRGRFEQALAWYAQCEKIWRASNDAAGTARALRGRALVHLDQVEPARAEGLLQEALRVTDGLHDRSAEARLFELVAENKLNMGKGEEAEQLRLQAVRLREGGPSEDMLSVRVKLRTGQLDRARTILETWAREERGKPHPPRGHRETLLLLSLIYSMQGHGDEAMQAAREGMALGQQLGLPFLSAVGQMRLGHAYLVQGDKRAALDCYEEAIALGDQVAVPRVRVEARMGTTRARGFAGDLEAAQRDAAEAISIGHRSGDAWATALVNIVYGATLARTGHAREGIQVLNDALGELRTCGDPFGRAATRLWLAFAHGKLSQHERALADLENSLELAHTHQYDFLFTRCTLWGLEDPSEIAPLLIELKQRKKSPQAVHAAELLQEMGLDELASHPGYSLRVQTLGAFRVWRGDTEVTARPWRRRKARELLQLLVTRRREFLERDEILDLLWGGQTPEAAARDLKTTLNALNKVLEPARGIKDAPVFILRKESAYGLRGGIDVHIDADEFSDWARRAEEQPDALDLARRALALYQGDYLPEARYSDWASAERERLLDLYLRTATRLAQHLFARGEDDPCLDWCKRILQTDPAWEHAYQLMMQVYARRGDNTRVRRTFNRCAQTLRRELDVDPSPATLECFQAAIR